MSKKEKAKKPFFKKWWFWVIVLIVVVAAFNNNDEDKQASKNETGAKSEQVEKDKQDNSKKDSEIKTKNKKENGNAEKQSPLDKIKEKNYITSIELDEDGTVNAVIDGKNAISVNFTFDKAVDILEDMNLAFEDKQVTGYYAMVMIDVIDSKGNEREEEGFNLYYSRKDFEALNYDNFYNLSYSEPYRIFNESTSYLINPVMYKDLKDDYKNNLTYEHNKPNYVTE